MGKVPPKTQLPVLSPVESELDVWMSIRDAAEYGNMSINVVYEAIKKGLRSRKNPVSNLKEVPKEDLEMWFCPFKKNTQYEDRRTQAIIDRQRNRITQLRSRIDLFRSHIDDLQDIVDVLKEELEKAHKREEKLHNKEEKLLEIITNNKKKRNK